MNKEEIKQVLQEIEKEKNVEAVEESSIDWQDLLSKAWKGKKFIITVTVVFMRSEEHTSELQSQR